MTEIELKFTIIRVNGLKEMRRVRLVSPSFDAIQNIMRRWVRGIYNIEYVDDEGDHITVESEEEWTECIEIWKSNGEGTLKLRINNSEVKDCSNPVNTKYHNHKCGSKPFRGMRCWPRNDQSFPTQYCCRKNIRHPDTHIRHCVNFVEPPLKIEGKCTNCSYSSTGIAEGYCCLRCRHGNGMHGPRCRRIIHSEGRVDKEALSKEADHCCRRNMYHPGVHGRRCVNFVEEELNVEGKCTNCSYSVTGITEGFCCNRCRHGNGEHGPRCRRIIYPEGRVDEEAFSKETQHCCRRNFYHSGFHGRNCANFVETPLKIEGKCTNCSYSSTGIAEGYCCLRCRHGNGMHGPRCRRIIHSEGRVDEEALSKEADHCCRRNMYHPGVHGRRCVNFVEEELKIEGKCTNCSYSSTGIAEGYCCLRCRHGNGMHGPRCRRIIHSEGRVDEEALSKEADHCCKRSMNRSGFHGRRCVNFETAHQLKHHTHGKLSVSGPHVDTEVSDNHHLIKQQLQEVNKIKCSNCSYSCTGIIEGFCCLSCSLNGSHGPRCQRVTHIKVKDDDTLHPSEKESSDEWEKVDDEVQPYIDGKVNEKYIEKMGFPITDEVKFFISESNNVQQVVSSLL